KDANYVFSETDFGHPDFKRKLSEYLLGEIKDQISFYYSTSDYELFLKFFEYLNGSHKFTYEEYLDAYLPFIKFISENEKAKPAFFETADRFLQFLYDLNILCYVEETLDEPFMRWCFRERNFSNISPKVKTHLHYVIHYGFRKALNLGKRFF
ncbi:MAG: funZ protein, partial [Bacteroidota bacterium]|nr:funZ protein [Bacteroidota bacterium]